MCFLSLSGIVYFLNDDPRPLGNVPRLLILLLCNLEGVNV